ncbi:MAG: EscU/YscU/HrcU family type III secretion system export apparatus switch protein [Sandaracinaceae bacterium]|nr:EscU/YscU/HrcU family type III secretion system export apparatus switch protein [Sandaracinaceae bacterium]MBP7682611.1 EscU/YscU/HrcU family type III secretion system export apparatus switch protein [Deltaproteobacteria bacterium]MBK6812522.1 EscU/YscU/HrcU family type III secretion system export apparatus switch protein [Sandaracinaceae bacterium]MBK7153572.1 EscU/YscU/HrcU family type III secretion system export apparatus switch protein [Sandaracinaceae bacterium]MBK7772517.1 EscU/YscU/Hr
MSEKTEQATDKKLREARQKGQVPKSRELSSAVVLLALTAALASSAAPLQVGFRSLFELSLASMHTGAEGSLRALTASLTLASTLVLPILLAGMFSGVALTFLQVGPLLTFDPISPDLSRVDPLKGTKQLFSLKRLVELLKSLALLGLVTAVAWVSLRAALRGVLTLVLAPGDAVLRSLGLLGEQLFLRVGLALLGVGVLDLLYQRWQFQRDQRMSKDEVKREYKNAEGDGQLKHERKRKHQEIIEHQTLEQVRGADALIVNPTHLAVAIHYDEDGEGAPEVLAKGADHLAQKMIAAAREAGVPVLRDIPLARSLYELSLGEEIPEELYDAVAAILHVAWQEREAAEDLRAPLGDQEPSAP